VSTGKSNEWRDRELGMGCPIARRDFLNGVALGIGAYATGGLPTLAAAAARLERFAQDEPGYYPPARSGMRGSHPGSYAVAHSLRDGTFAGGSAIATGETYDLVIVGAGIGGLAAAYFYRKRHPAARILILDNHDDFGGHAKRNEFEVDGRMLLANGGTYAIESPFPYSAVAYGLLAELGVDPVALAKACDRPQFYRGLGTAVFFDKETFGADRLVVGMPADDSDDDETAEDAAAAKPKSWVDFLSDAPLTDAVKRDIARVEEARTDYMPGLTSDAKKEKLSRMSYRDFLLNVVKVDPGVIAFYQSRTHDLFGVGIDGVTALDCWGNGLPGFSGLALEAKPYPRMGFTAKGAATPDQPPYEFHFPDGNATLARLLVRALFADGLPGSTPQDAVTARADYARLDRPGAPVRLRLSSTAVSARHRGDPATAKVVDVAYERAGRLYTASAGSVVMAGWNMMISYVVPELPAEQKTALRYGKKVPLVYTVVALRRWEAFRRLGVEHIVTPGMFHVDVRLDDPVQIGSYASSGATDRPVLVKMLRTPCKPGLSERAQHEAGRYELLGQSFELFERNIRDQLARVLGPGGFDSARDIAAITVNRWPHGYAYEYNPLWDPDSFFDGGETPNQVARRRFGRIAIANSDAAAAAYTDQAIDQAHRAVDELG
jgi:spermidine dehydrogenase